MYQKHKLDNGLQLFMVPINSFQSVSIGVFVRIGSRYENQAESGISHFIEHMLFKGTRQYPTSRLIAEAIEGVGGISNAYTSQEETVYYARVAASQTKTALNFLAELIKNPLLSAKDFEKERMIIGEEINMVYDDPESWINVLIDDVIWPNHPLGQSVAGTHKSLAGISHEDLVSFFKRSYHPENILITVGGAFQTEDIIAEITNLLGDWQTHSKPSYQPAPQAFLQSACYIEDRAIEQGHLCLALPGLARSHPERYALSVMNTILGDGMSSRLFLNIREEKGLAYAVDSGLTYLQDAGSWVIYAGVDPKRAPEVLQAILTELAQLREQAVPAEELHKAKEYIKGRLVLGLEDSYSQAAWVAHQALFSATIRSPAEVIEAYSAVTVEDVQAIAAKLINPVGYNLAAIGPFGQGKALSDLILK